MLEILAVPLIAVASVVLQPSSAFAHCDAFDGPRHQAQR